ncbi:1-deoxy-D-xylulose-5-phosphate reductoisomerase [bacterium]|nr:1-deoxy-D-xylulose-5-phosphate reductoisomerase [bacterium]
MPSLSILGSTGSIGRSALDVVRLHAGRFQIKALAAGHFSDLLAGQIREFSPDIAAVKDPSGAKELQKLFPSLEVRSGSEGVASLGCVGDIVLLSVVGVAGLQPALNAVRNKKRLAIATKEALVAGGEMIMAEAKRSGAEVIPVDSEHSAIFQCLIANGRKAPEEIANLIITASGGPFRGKTADYLEKVTPEEALAHPVWRMGKKISIDSATMMNKGLEVIEASRLYNVPGEKIKVLLHPQSIVHSLVEFADGAQLAQLSLPDMRLAIQYALTFPERAKSPVKPLDLSEVGKLEFFPPDLVNFPSLELAYRALKEGGVAPAVLSGANERAVGDFLEGRISFNQIPRFVERKLDAAPRIPSPTLEDIIMADSFARERA